MAQSGRIRHRDREPGLRDTGEREVASPRRAFRITDAERQEIARCLKYVDEARRVVVEGEAPLRLTDYGVPVPSKLGLIGMEDEVKIWIALRARATGEVTDAR